MDQSFFFDWAPSTQPVPIPTVEQCSSISISWTRTSASTGPNPVAPYYLQVYTDTFVVPLVIEAGSGTSLDWVVPFIPGTQFQICMFASNGATGGCQRMYTVIPTTDSSLGNPPVCRNLTYPQESQNLGIQGIVSTGPLSQSGWVNQCSDIQISATNGTPPYILTVAPTLHPPVNITFNQSAPINWTVALSWGSPFFLSVVDSAGNFWANGPLHSGGPAPSGCLAALDSSSNGTDHSGSSGVAPGVAIGSGIGGLAFGLLLGGLGAFLFLRRRGSSYSDRILGHRKNSSDLDDGLPHMPADHYSAIPSSEPLQASTSTRGAPRTMSSSRTLGHTSLGSLPSNQYHIEPFIMPNEVLQPPAAPPLESRPSTASGSRVPSDSQNSRGVPNVYVVHHDGGRPPVTVFTDDGTQVIELPPQYIDERSDGRSEGRSDRRSGGGSEGRPGSEGITLEQRRTPGQVPAKRNRNRNQPGGTSNSR
ncbi:hypothetical protein GLOTRDRAFT_69162 [Gloeophyllum trabeum ATCC 11539]|uniref:Uncharacterized protein n=1 Tax=Gloeophyllum trabeum (strain ATCC 11539 / FP-39264 / Madison 617) TaxID=670483 RepID=S7S0Y0_GLOTA|nr:uncharacterized protein GLOTRDRAFT_69162 [Gloeophyllum trabeum ATCC 11539]EPQ61020.1 hypothetical protein GLOTRDRAFT_69162 [Gloeophyllum trabeum ATCC 11539]